MGLMTHPILCRSGRPHAGGAVCLSDGGIGRLCFSLLLLVAGIATALMSAEASSPLPPSPLRPGGNDGPTKVGYAVWLGDVTRIDSAAQMFSANFVVILRWRDPQLAHAGPDAKRYALDDIWHPRFLIANEAEDLGRSLPEMADVAPDGTATYRQRIVGSFAQALNLRAFPFDHGTFRIQFVVPGERPQDIQFEPDPAAVAAGLRDGVSRAEALTLQDWRVTSTTSRVQHFQASPQVQLAGFSFEFAAMRQSHHFVIKVIIPLILIVMMSWAVFWIEPLDASTQMSVAVTAMLTLIAYQFVIDSDVPDLPYLTRLDAFILMSSVLVFLSLIEVLVTTKFANRDRMDLARAIDRRCRWIFPVLFAIGTLLTLSGWAGDPGPP
jgi:hypothetical protein